MKRSSLPELKWALWVLGAILVGLFLIPRSNNIQASDHHVRVPSASDWSHHHLVYSAPKSSRDALRLSREPRYVSQWNRRHTRRSGPPPRHRNTPTPSAQPLHRDWSEFIGGSSSSNAVNYPAKYSFDLSTADCNADFVAFTTGIAGSPLQPTIAAFNNLYSGCPTGSVPNTFWAYSTGTGNLQTAPVLSLDGTKLAMVETSAGGSILRLIKYANGEGTFDPVSKSWTVGAPAAAASWTTGACAGAGSCMISVNFTGIAPDTGSSPFYDYDNDVLYVGDDSGVLHKFSNVFGTVSPGTPPAEVLANNWPVTLTSGNAVNSPVFDNLSGMVIATDDGGIVYEVAAANAAVTSSGPVAATFSDGPVVDGTTQKIYAFAGEDNDGNAGVFQFDIAGLVQDAEAPVGASNGGRTMYAGDFDNAYYSTVPSPTGNLYTCGNPATNALIYQIPIANGVMSSTATPLPGPLMLFGAQCGPITEIFNPNGAAGPTDWIFASVQNDTVQEANCSQGGCLMNLNITPWQPGVAFPSGQHILDSNLNIELALTGGTSGGGPAPVWNPTAGGTTTGDGTVLWVNQGPAPTYTSWLPSNLYIIGSLILDSNGFIQQVTATTLTATSGGAQPTWIEAFGNVTPDNTGQVVWTNLGPAGSLAFSAPGGASGVVVDNFVPSGSLVGTSQIYFLTLAGDYCETSNASGGCAIQISQSGLQ